MTARQHVSMALLAFFLLFFSSLSFSADYYLSSTDGDDRLNGLSATQDGSAGPFSTLGRLETISLKGGDRILLKCGDVFKGPVNLKLSLNANDLVIIDHYGDCSKARPPLIDGRISLSGLRNGKFLRIPSTVPIELVFVDGRLLPPARFPNGGYLILPDGLPGIQNSIPALQMLTGKEIIGAKIQARTQEWFIEERKVVSSNGQLDTPLRYPLRPKTGFYLTGKSWMLAETEAWAYDATTQELAIVVQPSASIEVVKAGHLVEVYGTGSLQISGVELNAAGGDALNVRLNGYVTVKDSIFRNAVANGISVAGAKVFAITGSAIEETGLDGIFLAEVKKTFIHRNSVIGAGMLHHPKGSLAAINAHRTESATVSENMVSRSAYHGIRFAGDARISRNYIEKSCLRMSDCAAIYTWRRNALDERPPVLVSGNLVLDVAGDTSVKLGVNDWFSGIYLDDFSNNISVRNNIVIGANQGVYLHNAWGSSVQYNVIHGRRLSIVDAADSNKAPKNLTSPNVVSENIELLGGVFYSLTHRSGMSEAFSIERSSDFELRLIHSSDDMKQDARTGNCSTFSMTWMNKAPVQERPLVSLANCN